MTQCSPSIYRVRQLLSAVETECDKPAYISASTALEVQVSPSINITTEQVENNVVRKSLTRTPNIPSTTNAEASITAYAKGSGSLSTAPSISTYLIGSGHEQIALRKATYGSTTGSVRPGDAFTAPTGSGVIRYLDDAFVYFDIVSGTVGASDTLTTSGGTVVVNDAHAVGGFAYLPISSDFKSLTIRNEEGGVICKEIFGAMGNFNLSSDASNPLQAEFTFMGRVGKYLKVSTSTPSATILGGSVITWGTGSGKVLLDYTSTSPYLVYTLVTGVAIADTDVVTDGTTSVTAAGDSATTVADCGLTDGITYEQTIPPILQCSDLKFGSLEPIVQNISFDVGNEVTMRQSINSCDGYAPAYISSRNPRLTLNPEVVSPEDYDFYGALVAGSVIDGTSVKWGSEAGNTIVLTFDKLQIQSISDGDRDGISIFDIEATVLSDKDDLEYSLLFI